MVLVIKKNSHANAGNIRDPGLIPGLGRCPGEGNGNQLWYSHLESPIDRGAWWAILHGVTKSWTQLNEHSTAAHVTFAKTLQQIRSQPQVLGGHIFWGP